MEHKFLMKLYNLVEVILKTKLEKLFTRTTRNYSGKKAKNAQEAHEAIRPTDINRNPVSLKSILDRDQMRLYELIWNRPYLLKWNLLNLKEHL